MSRARQATDGFVASMAHEFQLTIPIAATIAAGLLILNTVNSGICTFLMIPMTVVGFTKICMANDRPRSLDTFMPSARILVDIFLFILLLSTHEMIEISASQLDPVSAEKHGRLFSLASRFTRFAYLLIAARGGFLLLDNMVLNKTLSSMAICFTSSDTKLNRLD